MPETASAYKVKNPFNPRENLEAGARYMKDLLQQFNQNLVLALAAYNAGPTSVLNYNGVPPFPETTRYVRKVLALKEERR
jgi:soluble lytic murein transglycosylase-like protein